ncbi:MAG: ParB/RepB/Spo0J family partition protein [Actinomycetes bacterium]
MSDRRRGLGRGLGALIPTAPVERPAGERPVDVFFPEREPGWGSVVEDRSQGPDRDEVDSQQVPIAGTDTPGEAGEAGEDTLGRADELTARDDVQPAQGLVPVPGAQFAEIPVDSITPNPQQPRQVFDEEAMEELVHSIREIGVLQPVVVRRRRGAEQAEDLRSSAAPSYELVVGERRWRASQQAGLPRIPAIVRETSDDALLRDALLENLHRSDLNPLEEAAAYQQLLDDFGCTHDELAERLGRSRPQVSNTVRLLKLPPLVQRRVAAGVLSAGHARALLGLNDAGEMERLAQRIVAEGLSVRSTEEVVALGEADGTRPRRRRPRPGEHHAALDEVAARLSERLDTRVTVALGQRKGRLTVEFASVEDLNRILSVLAPEEERVL